MGGPGTRLEAPLARVRRSRWLMLLVAAAFAVSPSLAKAASLSWSGPFALDKTSPVAMPTNGQGPAVSCPSAVQCTAVDTDGQEITFNPSAVGSPTGTVVDHSVFPYGGSGLTAISCPSVNQCTAVDGHGYEVTFNPTAPGAPTRAQVDNSNSGLVAISCPSTTQCTTVDFNGFEETFNPTAPGAPTSVPVYTAGYVEAMACPSAHQCTVGGYPAYEVTFDPTNPGTPNPVALNPNPSADGLNGIACPSVNECVGEGAWVYTFDPSNPGAPRLPVNLGNGGDSVSCPTIDQCTVSDRSGAITFNPAAPSGAESTTFAGNGPFFTWAVACPTASECAVVGSGQEVTLDPTSRGTPTPVTIDNATTLGEVACASAGQCTAVDQAGGEVTFDPTLPGSPAVVIVDSGQASIAAQAQQGGLAIVGGAVACPSASQCTALEGNSVANSSQRMVTFNPATGTVVQQPVTLAVAYDYALACPSVSECLTVNSGDEVIFDPSSPGGASTVTIEPSGSLSSVACPSVSQCTAVDSSGHELTFDPSAPGTPAQVTIDSGDTGPMIVTCPTVSQCTAVDTSGNEVTFDPSSPGSPSVNDVDGVLALTGVVCPSVSDCIAFDAQGDEVQGNPGVPDSWVPEPVVGAGSFTGAGCSPGSASVCVAVDSAGNGFLGIVVRASGTAVGCVPTSVVVGVATSCTATVSDTAAGTPVSPTGRVSFTSSGGGSFSGGGSCTLAASGTAGVASCKVSYTGTAAGSQTLTASYAGDVEHGPSSGTASVTVTAPSGGEGGGPGPALAPVVSGFSLSNRVFAVAAASTPVSASAARARAKQGTVVSYTLSEAATVKLTISLQRPGWRSGGRCVSARKRPKHGKRCTTVVVQGALTRSSHQGGNRVAFSGRIGSHALRPGAYEIELVASAAGKASVPRSITFTVVRK